ncbi:MAG: HAMP domain-containing histidine kinase [Actinomycetales bacterium]|nr:HAMP domain-containing histidine kinase [Actinomycetales bacterium]
MGVPAEEAPAVEVRALEAREPGSTPGDDDPHPLGDGPPPGDLVWDRFALTAAHDLRAPVHALEILARQVEAGTMDPLEFARHVGEVADRMRATLDSLLDVVDLSRASADPVELDLTALVESVEADLGPLLAERAARIETGPLPVWPVDAVLLRRALMNLVHNAVVHGGVDRPVVRIEGAVVRDCLCLDVADNGTGLPGGAGNAEALFEPFAGGDPDGSGMGIGLAICRGVAERHGGTITVPRTGPDGTTFRLVLPRPSQG